MKILIWLVAVLGGAIAAVAAIGWFLPVRHVATRSLRLRASHEQVWSLISDFQGAPAWRAELRSVERISDGDTGSVWRETSRSGEKIDYQTTQWVPEARLVRRIATQGLPFGGAWTFELAGEGEGSRLTITENGEVYNPVFRFVSRFVVGHTATIDRHLGALKARLGEA